MKLTAKQQEAQRVLSGPATHILLEGGSRSGKTFLFTRAICMRALKAPKSRHVALRFRLNHIKASLVLDTFPKVLDLCFPGVRVDLNKTDLYATFPNSSEVWFGGLDDKERTEKVLGTEYATLYLNETSQIPLASRDMALSRLAQRVEQRIEGKPATLLPLRAYYDLNPANKAHWCYRLFHELRDPATKEALRNPQDYVRFVMNPQDNLENLNPEYLRLLEGLSARQRARFLDGRWAEDNPNALFRDTDIEKWRELDGGRVPDMVRVVVGVDPSGSGDEDNADNDEIGIVVAGLGTDGIGYILEDCSVKAGPATWGRVATSAYERRSADCVVGEQNFGGEMVRQTILTARPRTPYKKVIASRGKVQRAEPFSALYEQGKVRHVGYFPKLEDELCAFSTIGYTAPGSPNRADAAIWALAELFPSIVAEKKRKIAPLSNEGGAARDNSWMG